jgi:predicted NBD/HSP70 family sugar kinase
MLLKYKQVIRYIVRRGPTTQAGISKDLHMNLMGVNKIINHLLDASFIVKIGKTNSRSGRKSDLYYLNPDLFLSVGMAINEERMLLSAVRSDGTSDACSIFQIEDNNKNLSSNEDLIHLIERYYSTFVSERKLDSSKITVLGVALEGIVDTENGRFLLGTHLGDLVDHNFQNHLESILNIPVFIDDPCRSAAFYENRFDPDLSGKNFISIYIGKGVGSGIVIAGEIYRGFSGIAGEVGHMVVKEGGLRCKCGNYGCLETIASEESIIRHVKEGITAGVFTKILDYCEGDIEKVDLDALKKAADEKDKFSLNVIEQVGHYLGKALALLVNILNPEYIVIGGEGVKIGSYLYDYVNRIINTDALNVTEKKTQIKISRYDSYIDSKSVAFEAFDALFYHLEGKKNNAVNAKLSQIMRNVKKSRRR